jgi:hypothetical protein
VFQFLAGFPLINRPTLFCLINENGKSFALFQKNKALAIQVILPSPEPS